MNKKTDTTILMNEPSGNWIWNGVDKMLKWMLFSLIILAIMATIGIGTLVYIIFIR